MSNTYPDKNISLAYHLSVMRSPYRYGESRQTVTTQMRISDHGQAQKQNKSRSRIKMVQRLKDTCKEEDRSKKKEGRQKSRQVGQKGSRCLMNHRYYIDLSCWVIKECFDIFQRKKEKKKKMLFCQKLSSICYVFLMYSTAISGAISEKVVMRHSFWESTIFYFITLRKAFSCDTTKNFENTV
ncbi:uncharacterized protein BX664DRAFT_317374 [Halteromyces radiatus]|uniref:uncharacterized protein n=1 Tax=Halteromyces radiatus TaxID=101107 RepID=UPI002221196D|nr:uncharacterized protein BX664DRAFT_317374 [Halteromyces radiatus]KAI8081496.1 hypothetical protein BX664DRAFT_317374 [Halteromyces radiatus]